jgi:hypothetical protein
MLTHTMRLHRFRSSACERDRAAGAAHGSIALCRFVRAIAASSEQVATSTLRHLVRARYAAPPLVTSPRDGSIFHALVNAGARHSGSILGTR